MIGISVNIGMTNPYTIGSVLVCGVLLWLVLRIFIVTIRSVKHLEAVGM